AGLAILIATALVLGPDRARMRILLAVLVAIGAGAPLIFVIWGQSFFTSLDLLGGLAAPAAVGVWFLTPEFSLKRRCLASAAAMIPALAFSVNLSALILIPFLAVPAGIAAYTVIRIWPNMEWRVRLVAAAAIFFAPFAGIFATWLLPELVEVPSILSRKLLNQVLFTALEADPWIFAIGQGWGEIELTFDRFLLFANAPVWGTAWDLPGRGTSHAHSIYLEALFGAGFPAVLGVVAIHAAVVLCARREDIPVAIFAASSVAGIGALSGQLAGTVGASALMLGIVTARRTASPSQVLSRHGARAVAMLLPVMAAIFIGAGLWLFDRDNDVRLRVADVQARGAQSPFACETHPASAVFADMDLARGLITSYRPAFERYGQADEAPTETLRLIDAYVCSAQSRAATSQSVALQLAMEAFRTDVAFGGEAGSLRRRYEGSLENWPQKLARSLILVPRRFDIAIGYLAKNLELENWREVELLSRVLLDISPDDPIGMWYLGTILLRAEQQDRRTEGLLLLARALEFGVTQVLEIPEELQAQIRQHAVAVVREPEG
ncbi:MAG: hypothetical protein ABJ215_12880, partial [Alphaproteobacteria bacterium]